MNIFLTGSEGFIGKNILLNKRIKNYNITKVDIKKNSSSNYCDIRDNNIGDLIKENSIILHLAAISNDKDSFKDEKKTNDININGLKNLINLAAKKKTKQFIFISTEWVYGEHKKKIFTETNKLLPTNLVSPYARSKLLGEKIILESKLRLPVTILRLGIVYGPRKNISSAVEKIVFDSKKKDTVIIGSKNTARRFIIINDVVDGIISSFNRNKNEIFNITGNQLITLENIIEACSIHFKKKINIIETNKNNPSVRNVLNFKAKKKLQWLIKYNLKEGIKYLDNYYSKNFNSS